MNDFYSAVSAACFALLGLWWVAVEINHRVWLPDPGLRRMAVRVSLYFLIPGTISLLSMLDDGSGFWRLVFLTGAVVGLVDVIVGTRAQKTTGGRSGVLLIVSFVVYVLIAAVAALPSVIRNAGITPLAVEGVLLALLIILGAAMAWVGLISTVDRLEPES